MLYMHIWRILQNIRTNHPTVVLFALLAIETLAQLRQFL